MSFREESDSMGVIKVPADRLWGAQTERSLKNFKIGEAFERMPLEIIYALALVKKSAAQANSQLKLLESSKAKAICQAADEVLQGRWDSHFPLTIWQTGSGTQSNMNVNEVLANRAGQILGGQAGDKKIHPNDDVNKCQSSNDVFPAAMHIASVKALHNQLFPALDSLIESLNKKTEEFSKIVKIGRTHLMDAVPLTLGQEFSGWLNQIKTGRKRIQDSLNGLYPLALGGTAVGTGLNAHPRFGELAVSLIAEETSHPFTLTSSPFSASSAHDELSALSGALKTLACSLMKLGNDIRLMASGPRAGLNEIFIPANEPGSSIMPGKVNPTQSEALTMVCAEVLGCDTAVSIGACQGHFELNAFKPLIIFNILRAISLLASAGNSFNKNCIKNLKANKKQLQENSSASLMLATALTPHIGYDKAAKTAKAAYENNTTLKEEAIRLKYISAEEFDRWVQPEKMTHQGD